MKQNAYALARVLPGDLALLEANESTRAIDRRTRKVLEQHTQEMARIAYEAATAQKALSGIYYQTLATTDATLTAAELLKQMRSPLQATDDLEQLDAARRERYLKAMNQIADNANARVIKRHQH